MKDSVYGCVKITHVPALHFSLRILVMKTLKLIFVPLLGGMKSAMMEKPGIMVNGQHQQ